jgi:uncharacterized protein (TIGR03437 family)
MSPPRLLLTVCFLALPSLAATFGSVTPILGISDLVLDEPRGRLYLIDSNLNRVDVYTIATRTFRTPITTGTRPLAGAMSRDGKFLYVTSYDQASLNVIDLDRAVVTGRVSLPANPEGVAVGIDGKALITTIGTGPGNQFNTLLVFDPNASQGAEITAIPLAVTPAAPPVAPPLGRTALSTRSALLATRDGSQIIGVNNTSANTRSIFVYEVSSATVLRARTVNFVSNVLSISPDGSRFMAGLTLFETATLTVLAQQNAANAPFSWPTGAAGNFNTQQNQGGSVFSPDGSTLYSAFNIAPVQNPSARPNVSRLLLNDPDNLLINLGLQLPENLAGKMVIGADGGNAFALSESGFLTLPLSAILQSPIAMPDSSTVLLANDQCGVVPNSKVGVAVNNLGRGRLTASAQLLQLPATATQGLGGIGGAGGGGGGTIVIVLPPTVPGAGTPAGVTLAPGAGTPNASLVQTSPLVQTQTTAGGANFNFQFNPLAGRALGTIAPHDFLIQSPEAINIPPNVRIFQNNRDSDARGDVLAVKVNAASNEGLFDMITDTARQRLYIANSGMNRVEVFDMRAKRFLAPIKVGQLPHSLALGTDGVTLYVANSGSETISVVDLDQGVQTGLVRFSPLPFNSNVALVTPNVIAGGLQGPQVVMSSGALWRVVGNQALPRTLNTKVFGNVRTLPGPTQTMASTPGGEFIFLLDGSGNGYLYDATVDDWVAGRQLFGAGNQTSLPAISGYFGPIGAGPRGQYFLANGIVFNQSLTQVGSATDVALGGVPARGGTATSVPVAAVAAASNTTFARFIQPLTTQTTVSPSVEVVDVNTGAIMRSAPALEGPLAQVAGNQTQRVAGRTLAIDVAGATAYALTTSGLSVIPLTPIAASDRPAVNPNGIVSLASYLPSLAPGSLGSIFGRNMAADGSVAPSDSAPVLMGGACVTLNNRALPLILTSDGLINFQVPPDLAAGRFPLIVRSISRQAASAAFQVTITKVAPAVFTDEHGQALIYHADGSLVTKDNPATRDEPLALFATGLGVTKGGKVTAGAPAPSSPLAVTNKVQVYFGNPSFKQSEVIVDWSGLVPGLIGVNRINLRVPGFHTRGDGLSVTLRIGGVTNSLKGPLPPVTNVD